MTTDFRTLSYEEKKELARNPSTSAEVLKILATDEDCGVRWEVALNPNTPPPSLKEQALEKLMDCEMHYTIDLSIIRRALEALPND